MSSYPYSKTYDSPVIFASIVDLSANLESILGSFKYAYVDLLVFSISILYFKVIILLPLYSLNSKQT